MASREDVALTVERQTAARRLLAEPLVTARTHPEDFALIRAHTEWLVQRFRRVLDYRLTVAADHARLVKTGLVDAVRRPLVRGSGAYFTPRTYSYLALAVAALLDAPPRLTVARLAAEVRSAAVEAGLRLDPADRAGERRAFAAALRVLAEWGVVEEHEGTLAGYGTDGTDAVLDVRPEVARLVLAHPPHTAEGPGGFLAAAESAPGDARGVELMIRRRLAETAVLYREDLAAGHRDRFAHHQWRAVAELSALLGCDAEIRAEGVALIMPDDGGSDARGTDRPAAFPSSDPVGQAALLLVGRLVGRLRPAGPAPSVPVPDDLLRSELGRLTASETAVVRAWTRAAVSHVPDPADFTGRVLRVLTDARLMAHETGRPPGAGWRLLAAAGRYGTGAADEGDLVSGAETAPPPAVRPEPAAEVAQ
ncbi:TIGR02678 family protein [Marinactinospora rubrisoli]|uniref:TIGR02678 family protein n=1 Tax=Marinactinospora rubrisoli TaxID=2715399 RepID=A0ABW2KJH0_9ACTN